MEVPKKIDFDEFLNSLTPTINIEIIDQFLTAYRKIKEEIIKSYNSNKGNSLEEKLKSIFQLKIIQNEENEAFFKKGEVTEYFGFEVIIGIMGISLESLKNVVFPYWKESNAESQKRETLNLNKLSIEGSYRDKIIELLTIGYKDKKLKLILSDEPILLSRFALKSDYLQTYIENDFLLNRIIEDKYKSRYSNKKGIYIEDYLIGAIFRKKGLNYEKGKLKDLEKYYNREDRSPNIDLIYPDRNNPRICIESSYQLTTASGQTKKIDSNHELSEALKKYSEEREKKIIFINFIDGAGWITRGSADLKRVYDNCDYILDYHYLPELEKIIDFYKLKSSNDNQSRIESYI